MVVFICIASAFIMSTEELMTAASVTSGTLARIAPMRASSFPRRAEW